MPTFDKVDHSLGVTRLLDELLREEGVEEASDDAQGAGGETARSAADAPPSEDVLRQTLRRTADLAGGLDKYLSAVRQQDSPPGGANVLEELQAEAALELNDTLGRTEALGDTSASVAQALRKNEERLQRIRSEIFEELRRRSGTEAVPPSPCSQDGEDDVELEALLAECDAINEVASHWRLGSSELPPGWRKLQPEELPG